MSAPTKATILGKLDMFEVDEVRAAINRFWDERDAENLHAVEEELARVKQHNETLMKKDANMLKKLQEMAKAKIEVEVEAMGLKLELGRMEEKKIKAEQERDQWEAKYDTMKAERDGSGGCCRCQNASPKVGDKVSMGEGEGRPSVIGLWDWWLEAQSLRGGIREKILPGRTGQSVIMPWQGSVGGPLSGAKAWFEDLKERSDVIDSKD
ncbi:hypothetical protein BDZ91DRAFT_783388 [Kalaharituber pfeilii]|nr:hypothetical protein BDZ91DRAFT_783388 [Kalaharituber pfeilii]